MRYDLFISYARRDDEPREAGQAGWITAFVDALRRLHREYLPQDLQVFMDYADILPGRDWAQSLEASVRDAKLMLAFVSDRYFASAACRREWEIFVREESARSTGGEGIFVVCLDEVPGFTHTQAGGTGDEWKQDLLRRQYLDAQAWSDGGALSFAAAPVIAGLTRLDQEITRRLDRISRALEAPGSVDRPLATFVGRRTELRRLRRLLTGAGSVGGIVIVHGLGGLGKSATVNEYARSFAADYPGGRWLVRCEHETALERALLQLATPLAIEFNEQERKDVRMAAQRIVAALAERARDAADSAEPEGACLLVLDNVDRAELLAAPRLAFLPRASWLHVVATTRLGPEQLAGDESDRSFLPLDELALDDAVELLARHQPGGRLMGKASSAAARSLVARLGGFTLAVEAVAVFLGLHPEITLPAFVQRLEQEGLAAPEAAAAGSSVAERLRHRDKQLALTVGPLLASLSAEESFVVECASLLAADFVPLPWLREWALAEFPALIDAPPGYPDPWTSVQRQLLGKRLLVETADRDSDGRPRVVRVHRLIQELVSGQPGFPREARWAGLRAGVTARLAGLAEAWGDRSRHWELEPLRSVSERLLEAGDGAAVETAVRVAGLLQSAAQYPSAETLWRKALALQEQSLGPNDPSLARLHASLGGLLLGMARYEEAEGQLRRSLLLDESAYGAGSEAVATDCNNLAALFMVTHRAAEAVEFFQRAIRTLDAAPGQHDALRISTLNNLAQLHQNLGDLAKAEPLMRRVLELAGGCFGHEHALTEGALCNLGRLLSLTGRQDEAADLLQRAVAVAEGLYGPEHPAVATNLLYLADAYRAVGRNAEARELLTRGEQIITAAHGAAHPELARNLASQAGLALADGRAADALAPAQRALEIFENVDGPEHPGSLSCASLLAQVMLQLELPQVAAGYQARLVTAGFRAMAETGQPPPQLPAAVADFDDSLVALGLDAAQRRATLQELAQPFGIQIGPGAAEADATKTARRNKIPLPPPAPRQRARRPATKRSEPRQRRKGGTKSKRAQA